MDSVLTIGKIPISVSFRDTRHISTFRVHSLFCGGSYTSFLDRSKTIAHRCRRPSVAAIWYSRNTFSFGGCGRGDNLYTYVSSRLPPIHLSRRNHRYPNIFGTRTIFSSLDCSPGDSFGTFASHRFPPTHLSRRSRRNRKPFCSWSMSSSLRCNLCDNFCTFVSFRLPPIRLSRRSHRSRRFSCTGNIFSPSAHMNIFQAFPLNVMWPSRMLPFVPGETILIFKLLAGPPTLPTDDAVCTDSSP